jgi:hypothetical protein
MVRDMTTAEINGVALHNLHDEIKLIEDEDTRLFTSKAVLAAPGRYWIRPSSSTGHHHPIDERGEWGNLIHVKRTIIIAQMFVEIKLFAPYSRDALYSGLLIHDIGKYGTDGGSEHTVDGHPQLVRDICEDIIPQPIMPEVYYVAEFHMGRWGRYSYNIHGLEEIGHYSDYIASRQEIDIPVELQV